MELSHELIKDFISLSKNDNETTKSERAYGTIAQMEDNSGTGVQLDGSQYVTPAARTTSFKIGDRVEVCIANHTAIVLGNYTDPSASSNRVESLNDAINLQGSTISAINSNINVMNSTIEMNSSSIKTLNTNINQVNSNINQVNSNIEQVNTNINEVNTTINTINSNLETTDSKISVINSAFTIEDGVVTGLKGLDGLDFIKTKDLTTESLNSKYANIDFTNIGKAAMEYFYSASGLIKNVTVGDQKITGNLIGVTISGDLIDAGTVKADKLVILGDNGLYYKLNVNSLGETTAQSDPKYKNGLDGSVIIAKSITATEIDVKDLVAFDATIGGFKITDNSIHSGVKDSADNTTRGIYLDNQGQIAFGDGTNFIKYYKDAEGNYRLAISAERITFGISSKTDVGTAIDGIQQKANAALEAVNEVQVGGRNIATGTAMLTIGTGGHSVGHWRKTGNGTVENIDISDSPVASINKGVRITSINATSQIGICQDGVPLNSDDIYTVSCWVRSNSSSGVPCRLQSFYKSSTDNSGATRDIMITDSWKRISFVSIRSPQITGAYYGAYVVLRPTEVGNYIDVCGIKFEAGNKPTDWSPAPEDVDTDINEAQDTADQAKDLAEESNDIANQAIFDIDAINGIITSLVTDKNGSSLMKQTGDGWTFSTGEIEDALNSASGSLGELSEKLGSTEKTIEVLQSSVGDLEKTAEYVRICVYEDEPCIELGESDSDFKILITNTRILFLDGSDIPAYVTNQSLNIKKANIESELSFGKFVWKIHGSGNLGLMWEDDT